MRKVVAILVFYIVALFAVAALETAAICGFSHMACRGFTSGLAQP